LWRVWAYWIEIIFVYFIALKIWMFM